MQARDYQEAIIKNTFDSFDRGITSGIIRAFTGAGKSYVATELAREWKKRTGGKTMFLVDQIDLAYQAEKNFKRQFPGLSVGVEMSDIHSTGKEDIMICSIQTISKKGSKRIKKFDPNEYTQIIVDECHKSLTPSWMRALHYLGVHPDNFLDGKLLVGLTATPRRRGGQGLGKLFHDFFGNYDIIYGMQQGWLVTPEWIKVRTKTDLSHVKLKGDFYDEEALGEALNNQLRNELIYKAWCDEGQGQAIIYCASVDHAYETCTLFKNKGVRAEVIEATTNKGDRKDWMEEFGNNEIDVLFNFGTLSTGIDFPELRMIVFARPIGSDILYEQILGRVLRPSQFAMIDAMPNAELRRQAIALSEKPYAKVIDLVDTTGSARLANPLTLLGVNEKVKTEDRVKPFEQVYEPLERVKKEHGVDISEIEDVGDIESIVTRSKGIDIHTPKAEEIYSMTDLKWFKVAEDEYELISVKDSTTLVVAKNELDRWDVSEFNMKSTSGMGKVLNTFNTIAGALRVADEYAQKFRDFNFMRRNAHHLIKPPSEKQITFIKRLFGRSVWENPDTGIVTIRGWGKKPDIIIDTMETAADIINKRLGK
jgi:superfamily II DNA or RNA helicase